MKVCLEQDAVMPTKAHDSDAGFDLYTMFDGKVPAGSSAVFDTGVHVELPKGTCGLLVSKSGLNVKHSITSTGLIDEGYTGTIMVKLYNFGTKDYLVAKGDKISQLVILPVVSEKIELVDSLDETDRGNNGFGSSGK